MSNGETDYDWCGAVVKLVTQIIKKSSSGKLTPLIDLGHHGCLCHCLELITWLTVSGIRY